MTHRTAFRSTRTRRRSARRPCVRRRPHRRRPPRDPRRPNRRAAACRGWRRRACQWQPWSRRLAAGLGSAAVAFDRLAPFVPISPSGPDVVHTVGVTALQGSFELIGFRELANLLATKGETGRLHVRARNIGADLYFGDGAFVGLTVADEPALGS